MPQAHLTVDPKTGTDALLCGTQSFRPCRTLAAAASQLTANRHRSILLAPGTHSVSGGAVSLGSNMRASIVKASAAGGAPASAKPAVLDCGGGSCLSASLASVSLAGISVVHGE